MFKLMSAVALVVSLTASLCGCATAIATAGAVTSVGISAVGAVASVAVSTAGAAIDVVKP